MAAPLNQKVKQPAQSQPTAEPEQGYQDPTEQEQQVPGNEINGQQPMEEEAGEQDAQAASSEEILNSVDQILDLSTIKTFGEAYRQAKAAGANQFRWKPDKMGNDIYTCGHEQPGADIQTDGVPSDNGQAAKSPASASQEQAGMGQEQKKPGLMSKVKNYITGNKNEGY
jgi:hypothetical protein